MLMFKSKIVFGAILILALLAVIITGCSSQNTITTSKTTTTSMTPAVSSSVSTQSAVPAKAVDPLKVGIVTSLSGQLSVYCLPAAAGIQFVIDDINQNGGIKSLGGAKIELVKADDKGDPTTATSEMGRLNSQEKVAANFEGPSGSLQQALAPVGDRDKVPQICVGAHDASIPVKGFNFWYAAAQSIYPANSNAYLKLFDALVNDYKVKAEKIALLTFDDPATQDVRQGIKEGLKDRKLSGKLILDEVHPMTAANLDSYAVKIKAAAPDILIVANSGYHVNSLYKAFDSLDYMPPIMISVGASEESVRQSLGEAIAAKTMDKPGVFSLGTNWVIPEYKPIADFAAKVTARGQQPVPGFISGAHAMYVLDAALEKAGSRDPVAINQALKNVVLPEGPTLITYAYLPEFRFTKEGTPANAALSAAQWQNGKLVIVRPFAYGKEPILPK
jgi:branched-chain amino acid transport system substrate-binding protein